MTQTHPTSEVAALVPTGGGESLCCSLLPPHPPLHTSFSSKTALIHQEKKVFFPPLGLTTHLRFHASRQ